MFTKRREKLRSIKADTARSRETIAIIQMIVDHERQKTEDFEINTKLTELEMQLGEWRVLLAENEALIAKLERPFWKF